MKHLCVWLLLFSIGIMQAHAQKILTLNKNGPVKRIRYQEKEQISFKLKGEKIVHTGWIGSLTDSTFLLNDLMPVRVSDITMVIDYEKGRGFRFLHKLALAAGIMYYGIGTANRIIFREEPVFEKRFVITSAALIAGSFAFKPFTVRKYRINKYRYLKVLDVTIE